MPTVADWEQQEWLDAMLHDQLAERDTPTLVEIRQDEAEIQRARDSYYAAHYVRGRDGWTRWRP